MESFKTLEQHKSIKEGGLESGIVKIRESIATFTRVVDQIEHLQKVPQGYANFGEKVDSKELPALDQTAENRANYEEMQKQTEICLSEAKQALLKQLSLLRSLTGVNTEEEAIKFDKNTGRQEKDNH